MSNRLSSSENDVAFPSLGVGLLTLDAAIIECMI